MTTRIKIEDIAKELGLSSSELMIQLNEAGFKMPTRSKTLTEQQVADIRERWGEKKISLTEVRKGDMLEKRIQTSVIRRRKVVPVAPEKPEQPLKPAPTVSEEKAVSVEKPVISKKEEVSQKTPSVEIKAAQVKELEVAVVTKKGVQPATQIEEKEKKKTEEKELKKKEELEEIAKKRQKSFIKKRSEEFDISSFSRIERIFQPAKKRVILDKSKMKATQITTPKQIKRTIHMSERIGVHDLSSALKIKLSELIRKLRGMGVEVTEFEMIDADTASLVATEYGYEIKSEVVTETTLLKREELRPSEDLKPRPPVVTIMGHVDHGKTTLLDAIRKSDVAVGEAGGITQHIGAYMVQVDDKRSITFIDTPGHEAFSAMRARGAKTTDIVVLVVAADDGVMPQTKEAIAHAKAAQVPIIVAINKMDKPGGQVEKIKKQLSEYDLVPEEWGGKTIYAAVSAKTGQGIKELLELILLQADMLELKASSKALAEGVVLEAKIAVGLGPMATILVQQGTLKKGDMVVTGTGMGRIRLIQDNHGKQLKESYPSYAVEISGLDQVPFSGDRFYVFRDEEEARRLVEWRSQKQKETTQREIPSMTLEAIYEKMKAGDIHELKIVLKADVQGSVEVIRQTIEKLSGEKIKLNVIFSAPGAITESDVHLAFSASAIIIGFNIRPDSKARELIKKQNVDVRLYSIIYDVVEDLKKAMSGMLKPELKEALLGRAEVRNVFHVSTVGTIAGCFVTEGKVARNAQARLLRDHKPIYTGKITSLKRFKEDAREVQNGFECGISIQNYSDIKTGDIIEAFLIEEIKPQI